MIARPTSRRSPPPLARSVPQSRRVNQLDTRQLQPYTSPDNAAMTGRKNAAQYLLGIMTFEEAHRAIKRGQTSVLEAAVPATISANSTNRFGWTLLMLAALEGNTKIGTVLLDRGADVGALNNFGESALSLAAHKGHLPFVKLLTSCGASGDIRPHGHDLESWLRNASGLSKAKIDAILEVV
ncbi:MAG: Ankyrin [Pedosphaera sp.]|nr:Ankyrin [Pedosphaera sp.]